MTAHLSQGNERDLGAIGPITSHQVMKGAVKKNAGKKMATLDPFLIALPESLDGLYSLLACELW